MRRNQRAGFTVMESVVGLACLVMAATLVAQMAAWSLIERGRADTRLAAMEWAATVLEKARGVPWSKLTPEWADQQKLPPTIADRMLRPAASVQVLPELGLPGIKRVAVSVRWEISEGAAAPPVELMTLFADRQERSAP